MCVLGPEIRSRVVRKNRPLVGYRRFSLVQNKLCATTRTFVFRPFGVNTADRDPKLCRKHLDMHGFWAFKDYRDAYSKHYAIAKVEMWGKTVIHNSGYRSRYLRIIEFITRVDVSTTASRVTGIPHKESSQII